ncbi:Centrosomal protein of 162 kDa, partial [Frankliniella fusca]
ETLRQAEDQSRAKQDATSQLRAELEESVRLRLRAALEREIRPQMEKEAAAERARAQDLERQVRELEAVVRGRQLQLQTSSDLPCSPPARERQLQEQLQAAEQQLRERHAAVSKMQAHLQAVKAKYEDLVSSLELQLTAARQEAAELRDRATLPASLVPSSASSEAGESQVGSGELHLSDEQHQQQQQQQQQQQPRRERAPPRQHRPRPRRSQSVGESSPALTPSGAGPPPTGPPTGPPTEIQVMPHQQNRPAQPPRPETHLLATIRGLQHELQTKEKEMAKLNRELSDARATNRRLQQERQRLLNEVPPPGPGAARKAASSTASAPPAAPAPAPAPAPDPDMVAENRGLRRDVQRLQEDLLSLHAKRVSDLTRLQAKHEEELESVVCERVNERLADRSCEGRVAELQGQLYTQQLVIAHLKEQLKHSEHGGEEVAQLKRERDQLEKSVASLKKQVTRLKEEAPPEAQRLAALQEQVIELEARHEARERKLQGIVRDLLQQRQGQQEGQQDAACCSASVRLLHKNRDLCFYRAEMDRLLEALRELERTRHST